MLANTQEPTKEETVKFINKTLNKAIGEKTTEYHTVTDVQFTLDKITNVASSSIDNKPSITIYENMDWAGFIEFPARISQPDNGNIKKISVLFTSKVKKTYKGEVDYDYNNCFLTVPTGSVESVKKAILHLVELAKEEEDSNPFK
jgi:beta-galactosidase GanA